MMRFGIFGAAQAGSPRPGGPMGQGFHDFIDFNVEAEALGYRSTFLVEHHFTGWNQVSATLTLLTWLAARTTTCASDAQAVLALPPILSGVDNQIRSILEQGLMEKMHGGALARLDEESEAWSTADAALRTAFDTLQQASDFGSEHAFTQWFASGAPGGPPTGSGSARVRGIYGRGSSDRGRRVVSRYADEAP